jgi:hypothetical protein
MRSTWPGFNDRGTVLIEVSPESFCLASGPVVIDGKRYSAKQELHITLIGSKLGSLLLEKIVQEKTDEGQTVEALLKTTFENLDWSYEKTGPVVILSRSKKGMIQRSIIMLIEMPAIAAFYQQLKSFGIIARDTPVPPAHVTLYTHNCPLGIGVPSHKMLDMLSVKTLSTETLLTSNR